MLFFNQLGEILTSEMLSLILICIVFLGCLYQLYSRRINFSGIIALFALLFLFLGFIIQGSFTLITLMLFVIGVLLLLVELFVFGAVLGIIGITLIIISFVTLGDNLSMMLFNVVFASILTLIEWVVLVKFFQKKYSDI